MKKARIAKENKKSKKEAYEENYSIKKLIIIILILVLVFAVFYFITTLVVKSNKKSIDSDNNITEIDNSKITLDHLLDRSEVEYYVLATKESLYNSFTSQTNYIEIYNKYISDYTSKEGSLKFYIVNLDDALNKNYIGEETVVAETLEELKLNDDALFKISNGKIERYFIGSEEIINALSELK